MSNDKQEYLLLFRGRDNWIKELSPEELQQYVSKTTAWFNGMAEKGIVKGGQPLMPEGRVISGKGGRTVSDGPFAESKETIGGYAIILAESLDEAVKLGQGCPPLAWGGSLEIRPFAEECPCMSYAQSVLAGKELAAV